MWKESQSRFVAEVSGLTTTSFIWVVHTYIRLRLLVFLQTKRLNQSFSHASLGALVDQSLHADFVAVTRLAN